MQNSSSHLVFTGIIQETGRVVSISDNTKGRSAAALTVDLGSAARGLKDGQSVSINGVCLTATNIVKNTCTFEMIHETIKKTNLSDLKAGSVVNIERSVRAGQRMEGHFVLGHIDGTATVKKIQHDSEEVRVWFEVQAGLSDYIVKKGSIAVDGISLTVTEIKQNRVLVCLIPHTVSVTNLATKKPGDRVNVETDILGKYVLK